MSDDETKLFVGGLAQETTRESLKEHFSMHGSISDAVVMYDPTSKRSRGFGFVTFEKADSIPTCLASPQIVDNKEVDCKRACPRDSLSKQQNSFRTNKIFVGGLPDVTQDEFRAYFAKFGKVTDAILMADKMSKRPRGFGFITYESENVVEEVVRKSYEHEIKNKWVEVKKAQTREQLQTTRGPPLYRGVPFSPYAAGVQGQYGPPAPYSQYYQENIPRGGGMYGNRNYPMGMDGYNGYNQNNSMHGNYPNSRRPYNSSYMSNTNSMHNNNPSMNNGRSNSHNNMNSIANNGSHNSHNNNTHNNSHNRQSNMHDSYSSSYMSYMQNTGPNYNSNSSPPFNNSSNNNILHNQTGFNYNNSGYTTARDSPCPYSTGYGPYRDGERSGMWTGGAYPVISN